MKENIVHHLCNNYIGHDLNGKTYTRGFSKAKTAAVSQACIIHISSASVGRDNSGFDHGIGWDGMG